MLAAVVVMVATLCVSAFAGLKSGSWSLNPADFRYDMSLYFSLADKSLEDLENYEIGAFVDDECRGVAEKLVLSETESCLYMRIRSNTANGEKIEFLIRDKKTGDTTVLKAKDGTDLIFKSGSRVGMPSDPYLMTRFYNVVISAGENGTISFENGLYAEGGEIKIVAVPDKGYHFESWSDGNKDATRTLTVVGDIELSASFGPNIYKVVFLIDGEELTSFDLAYGSPITAPEVPAKEGYSFGGWTDLPESMPDHDLQVSGSYVLNSYKLTFKIDGEVVSSEDVQFGAPIQVPDVQEKTGYTFNGWGDIPATMPAHDVEMYSSYSPNSYNLTFKIDDEIIQSSEVLFGSAIIAPEAPFKDGFVFAGWIDLPSEMPAEDLVVIGEYKVKTYTLTFKVDGEIIETANLEFGAPIVIPEAPEKEGYTFNGWGEVAETMPANDLEVNGSYSVNNYTLTYKLDGEVFMTSEVAYGTSIIAPEAPAKEGYSFSGWADVPATMPARNLEISGTYTVCSYTLTFRIDGEVLESMTVAYGADIKTPSAPDKEGYTFSGWDDVPKVMPASDLEINGSYIVNNYTLTFKIGDEVIMTSELPYGTSIIAPEAPAMEGYSFTGWGEVPAVMPAQDLEFNGSYEVNTYTVVYKVDGEAVFTAKAKYGEKVPQYSAADKEGYSFSGWGEIPASMPAFDLEFNGVYSPNNYNLTFKVGDVILFQGEVAYGSEIIAPEAPAKEGYTFGGWKDVPATMPATDLIFDGSYDINKYTITFKIEDEVYETVEYEYGATIEAPDAPYVEGKLFSGWGDIPETMPAFDLVFGGTYAENFYRIVFRIDGVVLFTDDYEYGTPISVPEAPAKEGYSFNGWGDVPSTMPAHNLEFDGSYSVNQYVITFKIDNEVIYTGQLAYGADIVAPDAPAKDGCSFGGWGVVPATMPAYDLEVSGSYLVNTYTLTYQIDGVDFFTTQMPYGFPISAIEAPAIEGYSFSGWSGIVETMPASDLVVSGTYTLNNYKLSFKIGEDLIFEGELPYGSAISVPDVPSKEGYTFGGWGMVPETMPAYDLEITGDYIVNVYNITYRIDGVDYFTGKLPYGAEIVAPEVPAKEGYTFVGWSDAISVMPASDVVISGSYAVNSYKLSFKIGEDVIYEGDLAYGTSITAPEAPVKDGYTFGGWGMVPETMPASDLEITGEYTVNVYNITFRIDGVDIFTGQLPYGGEIVAPEVPDKDGNAFSGWGDVPATMPAYDLVISGTYAVNSYKLTFKIGEDVIYTGELAYGTPIIAPEAPAKEGYTFGGWGMVPETMPASDLEITGDYNVNVYTLTFDIDGEIYFTTQIAYGAEITVPTDVPDKDGNAFVGWGDVPATMPAHDLVISGSYAKNNFTLTFRIGEEVIFTGQQPVGSEIVVPVVADKEGYTFSGWGDVPATMPSQNIEFTGEYIPNNYVLTFKIGDQIIHTETVAYGSEIACPEAPAKEGHTFAGWGVVPSTMPAYDVEITGAYDVNSYSVTFKIGEDIISSDQVLYGAEIAVPEAPAKEGHSFAGWGEIPNAMPAKDLEFNGSYNVNSYTLTFKIGDDVISSEKVAYGSEIVTPEVSDKEGYSFTGWGVVPATMPAYDVELIGGYEINSYSVTFKIGEEIISTDQVVYGGEITVPEAPAKDGHTFAGWGEIPNAMPAKDLEFNGSYNVNSYTLTFKIGEEVIFSEKVAYGSEIVAPEAPEKEGYSFTGWGVVPATMPASDIEFSGAYELNSYKIVFKVGDEVVAEAQVPYGAELTVPEAPAKEGHTFIGWGDVPATMPASDLVILGSYEANSYTVIFKIGDEVISESKVVYGTEIPIPETPEKEGYTFSGWGIIPTSMPASDLEFNGAYNVNYYTLIFKINDEVAYMGQVAYGADIVIPQAPDQEGYDFSGWTDVPATMPAHDLEFNATLTAKFFKVFFKIDGELFKTMEVAYGNKIQAPDAPVKEGYSFDGWIDLPETMPAHDIETNGTYSLNYYKANFIIDEEVYLTLNVAYGAEIAIPDAPEKYGYSFDGWIGIPESMPAHDIEIVGTYSINVYKITFQVDGEVFKEMEYEYDAIIDAPEAPEKEGYTFLEWLALPERMPADDLVVSAVYSVNSYKLSFYIDGELYQEEMVDYGAIIEVPKPEIPEGRVFDGWSAIPETMPAHDVDVYGTTSEYDPDGVDGIYSETDEVTVYTVDGVLLLKKVMVSELKDRLIPGLYIVNGKKTIIR